MVFLVFQDSTSIAFTFIYKVNMLHKVYIFIKKKRKQAFQPFKKGL